MQKPISTEKYYWSSSTLEVEEKTCFHVVVGHEQKNKHTAQLAQACIEDSRSFAQKQRVGCVGQQQQITICKPSSIGRTSFQTVVLQCNTSSGGSRRSLVSPESSKQPQCHQVNSISNYTALHTGRFKRNIFLVFCPMIFMPLVLRCRGEFYWPIRNMYGSFLS